MSQKIQYYIISHEDAVRLGVTDYRQGSPLKGYVVHGGDFLCATEDFLERATPISEHEAVEFVKSLKQ